MYTVLSKLYDLSISAIKCRLTSGDVLNNISTEEFYNLFEKCPLLEASYLVRFKL